MQGDFQIRLVEFGKNMKHAEWCLKGHFGYIIEGRLDLTFPGQTEVYEPGDALFIPGGEVHKHHSGVLTDRVVFFTVERVPRSANDDR